MELLLISEDEQEEFQEFFDEVNHVEIDEVSPEIIDGNTDVKLGNRSITEYDYGFMQIPAENCVFGRVLLEMIEEKGLNLNYPSTGFYIVSKKNYLYNVLHEKNVDAPKTVVIASEKAARNLEKELELPVIGKRFDNFKQAEVKKLEEYDEIEGFVEGMEYGETLLVFQEYHEGEKYRCMVAGDTVISLKDKTEGWKVQKENLHYSSMSQDLEDKVLSATRKIGIPVCEVLIQDEQIVDVKPNPDLELYTDISGKNAYQAVADVLKEDE